MHYKDAMKKEVNIFGPISSFLMRPVAASSLGAFRFFFGALMLWSTLKYFLHGWIKSDYIDQSFLFTYEWFPWVAPWPGDGMYYHFAVMAVSAFFLALGLFYRFSAVVFFLTYTHVFLLDKAQYNNHYYLICLLGLLFCLTHADRWMSVDSWRKSSTPDTVPFWQLLIFKVQVFIVYFYGGIAKMNWDWLNGEPMRHWIVESAESNVTPPIVSAFFKHDMAAYIFSYGGLAFDLGICFLLIWKKTRLLAIAALVFFHLTNAWLFSIGIFPYLMIGAIVLFLETDTPRKFLIKLLPILEKKKLATAKSPLKYQKPALLFFTVYMPSRFYCRFAIGSIRVMTVGRKKAIVFPGI